MHPQWLLKYKHELLKIIKEDKITEINCDFQSGSRKILRLMNRYYNIDDIVNTLLSFKKANKKLSIYSQFIIGFPSENDRDFKDTLKFIKRAKLDRFKFHLYSDREGTLASKMECKIPEKVMKKRLKIAKKIFDKEDKK